MPTISQGTRQGFLWNAAKRVGRVASRRHIARRRRSRRGQAAVKQKPPPKNKRNIDVGFNHAIACRLAHLLIRSPAIRQKSRADRKRSSRSCYLRAEENVCLRAVGKQTIARVKIIYYGGAANSVSARASVLASRLDSGDASSMGSRRETRDFLPLTLLFVVVVRVSIVRGIFARNARDINARAR